LQIPDNSFMLKLGKRV